jgi:hypothetical protein
MVATGEAEPQRRWCVWIDDVLKQVSDLAMFRHVFREIQAIVAANPDIQQPSHFYPFVTYGYRTYVVSGIRRQIKKNKDSISLIRLLDDIACHPTVLSRERWVEDYFSASGRHAVVEQVAHREFDCVFGPGRDHIDPDTVLAEARDLKIKAALCEEMADRVIAHRDRRQPSSLPTQLHIDESLDALEKLTLHYLLILKQTHQDSILPENIPDTWKVIFTKPWIASDLVSANLISSEPAGVAQS